MFVRYIALFLFLTGCATQNYRPLSQPLNTTAPSANTSALGANIKALETTLSSTKTRVGRISVLIDSLQLDGEEPVK
jgi:hypothetical protein